MMGWYGGWGGWFAMSLVMLAWVALVGVAVWGAARLTTHRFDPSGGARTPPPESARQILDRRLAAGEIDSDEYARIRHQLDERGAPHETAS
jgi:putative membrane protein